MRPLRQLLAFLGSAPAKAPAPAVQDTDPIDYDQLIPLDAERLAEQGIAAAYAEVLPQLQRYAASPLAVHEEVDDDTGAYAVRAGPHRFAVYGPGLDSGEDWARAAVALFALVNANLEGSPYRFYALYGDNDLAGVFLTEEQCAQARRAIASRSSWPYMPVMQPPHYGFPVGGGG
ncbi:hypothetical protein [Paracidovorax wautersii]|uniref:Uncharacterized protein n=1 Tax=Paracidovorax wautersii TaxID=1177982 RepID=A0ABU1IB73_9BURK|nr:hypothetical protein [Paracidovorax wautersii]MDR6213549.1 hypothetical protein [Paracidovorax wautersii]